MSRAPHVPTTSTLTILGVILQRRGVTAMLEQRLYMHVMHCGLEAYSQLLISGRFSDACSCRRLRMQLDLLSIVTLGWSCAGRWNQKYDILFIDQPVGTGFSIVGLLQSVIICLRDIPACIAVCQTVDTMIDPIEDILTDWQRQKWSQHSCEGTWNPWRHFIATFPAARGLSSSGIRERCI